MTLVHDDDPDATAGERLVARLQGRADTGLTTDQIMALTRE